MSLQLIAVYQIYHTLLPRSAKGFILLQKAVQSTPQAASEVSFVRVKSPECPSDS